MLTTHMSLAANELERMNASWRVGLRWLESGGNPRRLRSVTSIFSPVRSEPRCTGYC